MQRRNHHTGSLNPYREAVFGPEPQNMDTRACGIAYGRLRTVVLLTLVMSVALRAGVAIWLPKAPTFPDGYRYTRTARDILENKTWPLGSRDAPLHPLFLAGVYSIVGTDGTAVRLCMACVGVGTCYVIYLLAKSLFGVLAGVLAFLVVAAYPLHVFMSGLFEYPQTLFSLLLCSSVLVLAKCLEYPEQKRYWALAGTVLGLAVLAVPTALATIAFVTVWLLVKMRWGFRRGIVRVGCVVLLAGVVVLPWSVYWYSKTGQFMIGSPGGALSLFKGNCRLALETGHSDTVDVFARTGVPPKHMAAYQEYMAVERQARNVAAGPKRDVVYRAAVKEWFRKHPGEAVRLLCMKAICYWKPWPELVSVQATDTSLTAVILTVSFAMIAIPGIIGFVCNVRQLDGVMVIGLVILSQWITYSLLHVSVRYRLPIDPLVIVLAAGAVAGAVGRLRRGRTGDGWTGANAVLGGVARGASKASSESK
jgi:hypothetical protein